jgi:hypothetical protein
MSIFNSNCRSRHCEGEARSNPDISPGLLHCFAVRNDVVNIRQVQGPLPFACVYAQNHTAQSIIKIILSVFTVLIIAYGCSSKRDNFVYKQKVQGQGQTAIRYVHALSFAFCPLPFTCVYAQNHTAQSINDRLKSSNKEISVYQWKNHLVLFGTFDDWEIKKKEIARLYPEATIRVYDKPFYEFNRKQCDNQNIAPEWEHIVMTANLVADTTLQQEYMNYHARQRELFPEVAQGFCNADFQRLLVFRQGRQLMLIISIPKGKTLDELNPKTTENNPRVDEWNAIMSKYQEGIEGTLPDETWVILAPV